MKRKMAKIDMTPIGEAWQEVESFGSHRFGNKTLLALRKQIDVLIKEHGEDAQILNAHDRIDGQDDFRRLPNDFFRIVKYKPVFSREQQMQYLIEFAKDFDKKSAASVKRRHAAMLAKKNKK
jgi:hypothetical protein